MNKKESKSRGVLHPVRKGKSIKIPYVGGIKAGFTSPAADYIAKKIDLNKILIRHPNFTFFAYADGDCLEGADISNKDMVIIDKSLIPQDGDLVVCSVDGDFTMKRVQLNGDSMYLVPDPKLEDRDKFKPILVTENNNYIIWGVVTFSIKKHR